MSLRVSAGPGPGQALSSGSRHQPDAGDGFGLRRYPGGVNVSGSGLTQRTPAWLR